MIEALALAAFRLADRTLRRRFLLGDVWDRLSIDRKAGKEYAENDELMIIYRRAIFSQVVSSISRIGLMTERVRDGFDKLDLLGFAGSRALPKH